MQPLSASPLRPARSLSPPRPSENDTKRRSKGVESSAINNASAAEVDTSPARVNNLTATSSTQTAHTVSKNDPSPQEATIQDQFNTQVLEMQKHLEGMSPKALNEHKITLRTTFTGLETQIQKIAQNTKYIKVKIAELTEKINTLESSQSPQAAAAANQDSTADTLKELEATKKFLIQFQKSLDAPENSDEKRLGLLEQQATKIKELALCYIKLETLPKNQGGQATKADEKIDELVMKDIAHICVRTQGTPKQREGVNKFMKALSPSNKRALITSCAEECERLRKFPPLEISLSGEIEQAMENRSRRGPTAYVNAMADRCLNQGQLPPLTHPLHGNIMAQMARLCGVEPNNYNGKIIKLNGGSGQVFRVEVNGKNLMFIKRVRGEPGMPLGDKKAHNKETDAYIPVGTAPLHEHVVNSGYIANSFGFRRSAYEDVCLPAAFKEEDNSVSTRAEPVLITDFVEGAVDSLQPFLDMNSYFEAELSKLFDNPHLTHGDIIKNLEETRKKVMDKAKELDLPMEKECHTPIHEYPEIKEQAESWMGQTPTEESQKQLTAFIKRNVPYGVPQNSVPRKGQVHDQGYYDKLDTAEVQKIAILHLIYSECDPNSGNVMAIPGDKGRIKLQPIDAGLSLPIKFPFADFDKPRFWINHSQAEAPVGKDIRKILENFDIDKEAGRIEGTFRAAGEEFPKLGLDIFRAQATLVKMAVLKFNMAPSAIAEKIELGEEVYNSLGGLNSTLPPDQFWPTYTTALNKALSSV